MNRFLKQMAFSIMLILLPLSSCTSQENVQVKTWIDSPHDGGRYEVNSPVQVMSHIYAKDGVGEAMLSINGEAYRRDAAPSSDDSLVSISQEWIPVEAGKYIIEVKGIDVNGEISAPAIVGVEIVEKKTASATPLITATPVEDISPTALISVTPVISATFTPTRSISITPTLTYTIHPTITAKALDDQAPPVPQPMVPANGLELTCRATQNLVWQPVNDMSGIEGYYVKVELVSGSGDWISAGGYGPISGKEVAINVDCGIKYRWMVRAQDGAGNFSDWSNMSEFIITLD